MTENTGRVRPSSSGVAQTEPVASSELFARAREELYSGLLSDACDAIGLRDQCLSPGLEPAWVGAKLCGRARTMLARPTTLTPKDPYQLQIAATDTLGPDDVVVALVEGDPRCAFWGELFSTAAIGRGATGALIDGGVRDVVGIERLGFSVFARDSQPGDSLGRLDVVAYDVEVLVRGVRVMPGDLVFADRDGIVIVPGDAIGDVLERAFAKRSVETTVQKELLGGASLRDVFDRHKVL